MDSSPAFERIVEFEPAYHKVHEDPKKDFGVGGVRIRFVLRGPKGAIDFMIGTGWHLPETWDWWAKTGRLPIPESILRPKAWEIGFHAKKPQYEGQGVSDERCPETGGVCYYVASSLQVQSILESLIRDGHAGLWKVLEAEYRTALE